MGRIDFNRTIEVDGKTATMHWSSEKRTNDLREASREYKERLDKIEEKYGDSDDEEAMDELRRANAEFYRKAFGIMLDFEDGLPDVEWFMRPEFPSGMLIPLRQVFINPQIEI